MLIPKAKKNLFNNTVLGHGWYQLAPYRFDEKAQSLGLTISVDGKAREIEVRETRTALKVLPKDGQPLPPAARMIVERLLRHDEPFDEFFEMLEAYREYRWMAELGLGPLLRSPSVFEDIVKTICTTNCSWSLTKSMVSNLVEKAGEASGTGGKTFPTATALASKSEEFFKEEIRAGYRGPYLLELARAVAEQKIDPESWLDSEKPSVDLVKEIKAIKGVGTYAAEHILKMIGRYDGLALDSFLRSEFYKAHNSGKTCSDKKIEKHYRRFGKWKGLVIWFDMTNERELRSEN